MTVGSRATSCAYRASIQTLTSKDVRSTLGEGGFARSNLYQVFIENGWGTDNGGKQPFIEHLGISSLKPIYGFTWDDTFKKLLSFSCANATLPSSTYATGEIKDNYQGIVQEYAHTRINTDIDFSFYVDRDYKVLMFFEAWMNFISGGNSFELGYRFRNAYGQTFHVATLDVIGHRRLRSLQVCQSLGH